MTKQQLITDLQSKFDWVAPTEAWRAIDNHADMKSYDVPIINYYDTDKATKSTVLVFVFNEGEANEEARMSVDIAKKEKQEKSQFRQNAETFVAGIVSGNNPIVRGWITQDDEANNYAQARALVEVTDGVEWKDYVLLWDGSNRTHEELLQATPV